MWAYFINNAHHWRISLSCCGYHRWCQTQFASSRFFEPRCSLATAPVTMAIAATNPFLTANCNDNGKSGVRSVRGGDCQRRWTSTWRAFYKFPFRGTFWPMCITHGSRWWYCLTRWRRHHRDYGTRGSNMETGPRWFMRSTCDGQCLQWQHDERLQYGVRQRWRIICPTCLIKKRRSYVKKKVLIHEDGLWNHSCKWFHCWEVHDYSSDYTSWIQVHWWVPLLNNFVPWRNGGGPWVCILRKWHIIQNWKPIILRCKVGP